MGAGGMHGLNNPFPAAEADNVKFKKIIKI